MTSGEILLTSVVALLVFGPAKLPMLATHLGQLLKKLNQLKDVATQFWQQQQNELQLQENQRKAEAADVKYSSVPQDANSKKSNN